MLRGVLPRTVVPDRARRVALSTWSRLHHANAFVTSRTASSLDMWLDTNAQSELADTRLVIVAQSLRVGAPRIAERLCKAKNRPMRRRGGNAGDRTRTCDLRIMIPDDFGLAIGDSRVVGHPLDTNALPGASHSACRRSWREWPTPNIAGSGLDLCAVPRWAASPSECSALRPDLVGTFRHQSRARV